MGEVGDVALAAAVEACWAAVDACCAMAPASVAAAFATAVAAALRSTAGIGAASTLLGGAAGTDATASVADAMPAVIVEVAASGVATAVSSARATSGLEDAWRPAAASVAGRSSDRTRPCQPIAPALCLCLATLAAASLLRCRGSLSVHVSCHASVSIAVSASASAGDCEGAAARSGPLSRWAGGCGRSACAATRRRVCETAPGDRGLIVGGLTGQHGAAHGQDGIASAELYT